MPTSSSKPARTKTSPRAKPARPAGFDLKRFYRQLEIPPAEQAALGACLEHGLQDYKRHAYGEGKKKPALDLKEQLRRPYVFGFGAVAAVRETALSVETRLKVAGYALQLIDVEAEYGTPHGLPALLSFAASTGRLEPELFRSVMITADFEGALFDDWPLEEVHQLLDWVLEKAALPQPEKLWWVWYLTLHGEPPTLCRVLAETLLAHGALSADQKRALCQAWLTDTPAGPPPAQWEAMQALLRGDVEAFARSAAEAGLPVPEKLPSPAEIEADYDRALDAVLDDDGETAEPTHLSFTLLRRMLVGPMGIVPLTPGAYKREALFALPGLGEDPLALCQRYLDSARGEYYADAINQGVADVLAAYANQMPPEAVCALVEKGLQIGAVATRKAFYQVGGDLCGPDYLASAAQDPAKTIRDWAAKKTAAATRPTRRPRSKHPPAA